MPVIKQFVDGSLAKRRLPDEVTGPTGLVGRMVRRVRPGTPGHAA